jgi:hypothetical protein
MSRYDGSLPYDWLEMRPHQAKTEKGSFMRQAYSQLGLEERKAIEAEPGKGSSFRAIAKLLGPVPSTVSREVKANRSVSTNTRS